MAKVTIVNKTQVILHGLKPDGKLQIEVDEEGTPFDLNWRKRLRDAKINGCIEIEKPQKKEVKKKPKKEDKD